MTGYRSVGKACRSAVGLDYSLAPSEGVGSSLSTGSV